MPVYIALTFGRLFDGQFFSVDLYNKGYELLDYHGGLPCGMAVAICHTEKCLRGYEYEDSPPVVATDIYKNPENKNRNDFAVCVYRKLHFHRILPYFNTLVF